MDQLQQLDAEVRSCTRCGLCRTRTRAVPGEGPRWPLIMMVGEGPGYWEDQQGRPFVGKAGRLLEQLIGGIGLRREDVYITNVVKCRPPNNRDPLPEEIAACREYLERQIGLLRPLLIVTLGRFSMAQFFPAGRGISALHGTTTLYGDTLCLACYHPAAALRNGALVKTLQEDFARIPALLAEAERRRDAPDAAPPAAPTPSPEQLTLF
jgi:DNA polymerase